MNSRPHWFFMPNRPLAFAALLFVLASGSLGHAQTAGRARVRGEISGLEMALDGGLSAPRGGTLRFVATLYEVLGLSNLRVARSARVEVTNAIDPTAAAVTLNADANGRLVVEMPIPDDAPPSFGIVMRAISGSVQRRFELTINTYDPRALGVVIMRASVLPGGRVPTLGYLSDARTSGPVVGAHVRLTLRDEAMRTVLPPVDVTTDASGLYAHTFTLPATGVASATVVAELCEEDGDVCLTSSAGVSVGTPGRTPLLVAVAPERRIVEPGSTVAVDTVVRTGEGRPVSGATCTIDGLAYDDPTREQRTDDRGRIRFTWRAPTSTGSYSDVSVNVSCGREAIGSGYGYAQLRVARVERAASFSVEGGALIPSLGGRIYARVVTIDGAPAAAGVAVELTGPRFGTRSATTDASGTAVFDVTLGAAPTPVRPARGATDDEGYEAELEAIDNCGGEAATEVSIHAAGAAVVTACVPLDPDGTVRVRPAHPVVPPGGTLELELARTTNARLPVAVSVLRMGGSGVEAIAQHVAAAGESRVSIPLPEGIGTDLLLVRARPLHGTEAREVRGGAAMVWVGRPQWSIDATLEGGALHLPSRASTRAYLIGLPLDEAQLLVERMGIGSVLFPELGELDGATEALYAGALAARTPRDVGAPFVLRGSALTPLPAPADAVGLGLLRDPWRAQARFVTGRLALVFSAIEQQVAEAVPERIEDVAVETGGRFSFNAQILASIEGSGLLGAEGATGLGGEDLTVEAIRAFDPAFTYDNVARRITRQRLFRIMVVLRAFVQQNGFDLPWARLGDPSTWLQHLPETWTDALPEGSLQPRELVDGWGHPFVLRAAARPRFTGWSPLSGWEVASSGPDGRIGNGDDVVDPTARVLPSGSPYATAVGEDALVARLRGVELGRATVELLASYGATEAYVDGVPYSADDAGTAVALTAWGNLPGRLPEQLDPLGLRRPDRAAEFVLGELRALDGATVPLPFDEEPRSWATVTLATADDGTYAVDVDSTLAGSPLLVESRLPARVRVGEPLRYEVLITNVGATDRTVSPAVDVEGPVRATVLAGESGLVLRAGTSAPLTLELAGTGAGHAHVVLRLSAGGAALRTLRHELAVDAGRHPIRTRNAGLSDEGASYDASFGIPGSAEEPIARLVLLSPSGLAYDPDLSEIRDEEPALLAWSLAMAGRPLDDVLRAQLLRSESGGAFAGTDSNLSTACALVALASADEGDTDAAAARDRARAVLAYASPTFEDVDSVAGSYRGMAAVLAALAPGGVYDPASGGEAAVDPVAAFGGRLRTQLRRALRTHPEDPSILARTAAALLLADPRDARALAMYERASAHVTDAWGGRLLVPSEGRRGTIEELTSSLALAVAAHQVGDDTLALALVRAVVARDNLIVARGGEALFWWLAVGGYGVLGGGEPSARVDVGDGTVTPTFEGGIAIVVLPRARSGSDVHAHVSSDGVVIARLEAVYGVPFEERTDAPLRLEIQGDPGNLRRVAALELAITATEEIGRPIVYVELPAGVVADEELLGAIRAAPSVASVERRRPGFLRLTLRPMSSGTVALVPLAVRWTAAGDVSGLGVVAHAENAPDEMTVLPPRHYAIE